MSCRDWRSIYKSWFEQVQDVFHLQRRALELAAFPQTQALWSTEISPRLLKKKTEWEQPKWFAGALWWVRGSTRSGAPLQESSALLFRISRLWLFIPTDLLCADPCQNRDYSPLSVQMELLGWDHYKDDCPKFSNFESGLWDPYNELLILGSELFWKIFTPNHLASLTQHFKFQLLKFLPRSLLILNKSLTERFK